MIAKWSINPLSTVLTIYQHINHLSICPFKQHTARWSIISWVVPLPRMPVTTRILIFLGSGIPINLHLPLLLGELTAARAAASRKVGKCHCYSGRGGQPKIISISSISPISLHSFLNCVPHFETFVSPNPKHTWLGIPPHLTSSSPDLDHSWDEKNK